MEEEDPNPTYSTPKRRPVFRRDRHLQSALHKGEIEYMFKYWDNNAALKKEHASLKKDTEGVKFLDSDQFIHWGLLHVSKCGKNSPEGRDLARHIRTANDATELGLFDYCNVKLDPPSSKPPPLLQQTYCLKKRLARITKRITISENHYAEYNFFGCQGKCYGNLHVI